MAENNAVSIRPTTPDDRAYIREEMRRWWGDEMVVLRGETYFPADYGGFIAEFRGEKAGLILLRFDGPLCEIMSLTTDGKNPHTGKELLARAIELAKDNEAERLIVVTTNDNTQALRFYQQMGFAIREWRKDVVVTSRRIKPTIPLEGKHHIPIRDEIELEIEL